MSGQALSRTEIILRFQKPKQFQAPPFNRVQVDYGKQSHELKKKKVCYGSSCVISNLEEDTMYYFRVIGYVYQKGETHSFTQIRTLSRGMCFKCSNKTCLGLNNDYEMVVAWSLRSALFEM